MLEGAVTAQDLVASEKNELRRRMRNIRDAIPAEQKQAAALTVASRGLDFLNPPQGAIVSGYWPVRGEFDCLPLLERLERDGCRIALPVIAPGATLEFSLWTVGSPLTPGPFRIPVPAVLQIVQPSILIVPLLAFDAAGRRLGYGAGHYDRTLRALRQRHTITAAGLGFDEQGLSQVPANEYDELLDWLLTPSGAKKSES
jgi:5-formyltetrahydrofolate cyclo-ligase